MMPHMSHSVPFSKTKLDSYHKHVLAYKASLLSALAL